MPRHRGRTLVMTVGTGNRDRLDDTLYTPLLKSVADGDWKTIVLLPSQETLLYAEELRVRIAHGTPGIEVSIRPLPVGHENNADRAYAHFDRVLTKVLQNNPPENVEADFTRGTKAMSAALVLAATRRTIPRLRYIEGVRDRRGMVEPGSEQVRGIRTTTVDGHRRLDLARALFARGDFAAVAHVLPDPLGPLAELYPNDFVHTASAVRSAARFYAAWDRLDHAAAAAATVDAAAPPSDDWRRFWPTPEARAWVGVLAPEPERTNHGAMAARLRRLAVDLLANGERRVRQGQNEDALVRAYRLLELLGQARLFDYGLDSANLDPDHDAVVAVRREAERKKRKPFSEGPGGTLLASRFQVGRLLRHCGDRLAKSLLRFDEETLLKPTLRNNSVLVHGFAARAPDDPASLRRLFQDLDKLARDDCGEATAEIAGWLRTARSPAFDVT